MPLRCATAAAEQQPNTSLKKPLAAVVEELLRQAVPVAHGELHRRLRWRPALGENVDGGGRHPGSQTARLVCQ